MLYAIFIAFLRPALFALCNIVDQHLTNNLFKRVSTLAFYGLVFNITTILFMLLVFGFPGIPPMAVVPLVLAIAAIEVFGLFPYFKALRKMDTSTVMAIFQFGKIMIPILAFILIGEQLRPIQYLGFIIIVLTSVILSLEKSDIKTKINVGFWLATSSAILFAFGNVTEKAALEHIAWYGLIFWYLVASVVFSSGFLIGRKSRTDIIKSAGIFRRNIRYFALNQVIFTGGLLAGIYALATIPVTVFGAINATRPMFILLFGWVLTQLGFASKVREETDMRTVMRKLLGYVIIIIGVILIIANL
ncbi:MAG: DMT family transporter [Bacteroidales bacterium]|nr:DMT family transporter [Bacteroidales bacterium]